METELTHRPAGLFLKQARPPSSGQWELSGDRMTVGRDPASAVFVNNTCISRHHADLIRQGRNWSIIDAGSTNGIFINGSRVHDAVLRPRDRIRLGEVELVVSQPGSSATRTGPGYASSPERAVSYDVGWQQGNINNVAGDQANYYHESNLRYIASRRGKARVMIVSGILLFLLGPGPGFFAVLNFDSNIFNAVSSESSSVPKISPAFFPLVGLSVILSVLGLVLLVFGLIARGGAKREARRLGADWK
jgi:hypothetical protein